MREYAPVGEMIPGMAYFVRRLLENTSNESWLRAGFFEHASPEAMSEREARFVAEQMGRSNDHASWSVSPKQLFWLRDIKSKYAE